MFNNIRLIKTTQILDFWSRYTMSEKMSIRFLNQFYHVLSPPV
jgi:hypothetical protein